MASKLGRLRQWAGEVISSREKISISEEFRELEKDIELRKDGIQRLILASETYHHALSKRKDSEALDEAGKMLPIDILGVVMLLHGEEFGDDSLFGTSLVKLGRAHCKIATLQEAFAVTFKTNFIASLERFKDEAKEYEVLKKKLESKRVNLDSASAKVDKLQSSKKERDRREAEEELERVRQRYDETSDELQNCMNAIQENEHNQLQELTSFLDLETNFVQSYLDVLIEVKAEWQGHNTSSKHSGTPKGGQVNTAIAKPSLDVFEASDSSDEEASTLGRNTSKHSQNGSVGSKPPSRPTSRLSRKSANSAGVSNPAPEEKSRDSEQRSRRISVAGWASSAVESVTGSKSKRNKDTESYASLFDNSHAADDYISNINKGEIPLKKKSSFRGLSRRLSSKSKENLPANQSSGGGSIPKILKPRSLQDKKLVRALYDFSGSSDELDFKAGNVIVVRNEVVDDWWMGELDGKQGLFPISYTEVINAKSIPRAPRVHPDLYQDAVDHDESDVEPYMTSDNEQILHTVPLAFNKSPIFGGFNDTASIADSMSEECDHRPLNISQRLDEPWTLTQPVSPTLTAPTLPPLPFRPSVLVSVDAAKQPLINRSMSDSPVYEPTTTISVSGAKKIPPPPPPRRTVSHNPSSSPPIPERKKPSYSSNTTANPTPPSSVSSQGHDGYDRSPFYSVVELDAQVDGFSSSGPRVCARFRQNPFKPRGMCSNCLEFHD